MDTHIGAPVASEAQNNKFDRRLVVELIGIAVLIASAALLIYEIRQSRDASMGERFATSAEVEASIRSAIADHAGIWQRGCMGEELTVEEKTIFRNLVFAYTYRYFQRWWTSQTLISGGEEAKQTFVDQMAKHIRDYPGFRQAWLDMDWTPGYRDAVNTRVKELRPATGDIDPSLCGI